MAEKAAIALMIPAGFVGYLVRANWSETSILIPGLLSGLVIAVIISTAKVPLAERLWPFTAPAVIVMHVVGAATAALLASVALPDLATRSGLVSILEWTRPTSLLIFATVDFLVLVLVGLCNRRR